MLEAVVRQIAELKLKVRSLKIGVEATGCRCYDSDAQYVPLVDAHNFIWKKVADDRLCFNETAQLVTTALAEI